MTIPTGWTFRNSDAVVLDLDDGTVRDVTSFEDVGYVGTKIGEDVTPGRVGGVPRKATILGRTVGMTITVTGATLAVAEDNIQTLIAHLAASHGRDRIREGILTATLADTSSRALRCMGIGGLKKRPRDLINPLNWELPVQFRAAHPHWYDPVEASDTATILQSSGALRWQPLGTLSKQLRWPMGFGIAGFAGRKTVTYNGDAESFSLLWQVPGPSTNPALQNVTIGRSISMTGLIVPLGLTLNVRMGWRPDGKVQFRAFLDDGVGGETNVINKLAAVSRPIWLQPGANLLIATQDNTDATIHTFKWHDEFLSI